jgi:hypothetical protein
MWLDTGLKTFVSVLIMYFAVNTFWRYHPIAKARHVAAIVVLSALIMFAYVPDRPARLLWFLGLGALIEAGWYFFEQKKKVVLYVLFLTDKSHRVALETYFLDGATRHQLDEAAIRFLSGSSSMVCVSAPSSRWKPFFKEFERDFRFLVPILALRAYVTVLLALIRLAADWRCW